MAEVGGTLVVVAGRATLAHMRIRATIESGSPVVRMSKTSSPEQASATFQALSDPTRVRMLRLLASNETELCVCEFVDALQERQYNVSRQLKVLVSAGLVRGRKDGRWVYYSLCPAATAPEKHLRKLLAALEVDDTLAQDQKRFERRMKLRTDGQCRIGIQTPSLAD